MRTRIDELVEIGSQALRDGLLAEAMAAFERALGLLDSMPEADDRRRQRLLLLGSLWAPYAQLGRRAAYEELLTGAEPVAVALGDPGLLGMLCNRLSYCQWAAGDLERARATWMKALELCQAGDNPAEVVVAQVMLQWCRLAQGDYLDVLLCHEHTLDALDAAPSPGWLVWALVATACVYVLRGRGELAMVEAQEALAVAEEAADAGALAAAHAALALAGTASDDAGRVHLRRAVELARTPLERAWADAILGIRGCQEGDPTPGLQTLASVLPAVQAMHVLPAELSVRLALGEGSWQAGRPEAARETFTSLLDPAEHAGMRFHVAVAHRLLAEIVLETGAMPAGLSAAASHFEQSIALLRETHAEPELALAFVGYARLHERSRDLARARDYFIHALEIFDHLGMTADAARTRQRLAELTPPTHKPS